jgi:hypothetical protein
MIEGNLNPTGGILQPSTFREAAMPDVSNSNGARPLVDLTKMIAKQDGLGAVEWAMIIVSGGVGFLGLKAVQHFFPAQASPEEQIRNLIALIEAWTGRREDNEISPLRQRRICRCARQYAFQDREPDQHHNRS